MVEQPRSTSEYDAECQTFNGQEVLVHHSAISYIGALQQEDPRQIFTFTTPSLFGALTTASFRDTKGRVHGFEIQFRNQEEFDQKSGSLIWETIKFGEIEEVDGLIRVDPQTGDVYEIFQTETPDNSELVEQQLESWFKKAKGVVDQEEQKAFLQYLIVDDEHTIVDVTSNKLHVVTDLGDQSQFTLYYVKSQFNKISIRDNSEVSNWQRVILQG